MVKSKKMYEYRSPETIDPSLLNKEMIKFSKIATFVCVDFMSWLRAASDGQPHYLTKAEILLFLDKVRDTVETRF